MNKKIIWGVVVLVLVSIVGYVLLNGRKERRPIETPASLPTTIPASLPTTSEEYVFDKELSFGFNYPKGWEYSCSISPTVNKCDPTQINLDDTNSCTCQDLGDIKESLSFGKTIKTESGAIYKPQITLDIKSADGIENIKKDFKDNAVQSGLKILEEGIMTINEVIGSDVTVGVDTFKIRELIFVNNGNAYIFKYQANDLYGKFDDVFNGVVNSFKVK